MTKNILYILSALVILVMTSCSGDYRDAIPAGSTALISIDAKDAEVAKRMKLLNDMLHITDAEHSGIDFSQKLYVFETTDGNLGLCAKVKDDSDLHTLFKNLENNGNAKEGPERQKCSFFFIADKWVAGYTSSALLIMGPVVSSAQGEMVQTMTRFLKQDSDEGLVGSQMMDKLDELPGGMAMVAQAVALPEKVTSLFTIGLPKEADESQCVIAASIDIKDEILHIDGEPMSFNSKIDNSIKSAYKTFRPITSKYVSSLPKKSVLGFFANVDGKQFLPLLQQSQSIMMLLAGINQAIDINAIIKCIDGDVLISVPAYDEHGMRLSMAAQLGNTDFVKDIDYWKQSVPKGCKLTDWKKNSYYFAGENLNFYFGTTEGAKPEFFSGSTEKEAIASIQANADALDKNVQGIIIGKRVASAISLSSLLPEGSGMATLMLPQTLKIKTIVYTVK